MLEITLGDTVVWINNDPFEHSAAALTERFDSGVLSKQGRAVFVASDRGNYDYRCELHPVMEGKIVVR